jgi:hypothetical protein
MILRFEIKVYLILNKNQSKLIIVYIFMKLVLKSKKSTNV